jgi:hypothetical protein
VSLPLRRDNVKIAVQIEPTADAPPDVDYRWDADTDILSARLRASAVREGYSSSVDLEGRDGSWLVIDLAEGRVQGVEVAVWPDIRPRASLVPPPKVADARLLIPAGATMGEPTAIEVQTSVIAESDPAKTTFHFRLGAQRSARTVRVGRDLLADIDADDRLAGLWLLNVPPCPPA